MTVWFELDMGQSQNPGSELPQILGRLQSGAELSTWLSLTQRLEPNPGSEHSQNMGKLRAHL